MNTRKVGNLAENKVIHYLEKNNYIIKDKNYYTRYGEIDIIKSR